MSIGLVALGRCSAMMIGSPSQRLEARETDVGEVTDRKVADVGRSDRAPQSQGRFARSLG